MAKNNSIIPLMDINRQKDKASNAYSTAVQTYPTNGVSGANNTNSGIKAANTPNYNINTSGVANGNVGFRDGLSSLGLDNNKIGWDDTTKSVLYNGQAIYNPTNIVDGKSYASQGDIYNAAARAYENQGDPLVTATDYAAQTGVSNIVQWNGQNLSIGGISLNPVTVTADGKAIVKTSDIDNALSQWKKNTGYKSNADVVSDWQGKYGDAIDSYLNNKIVNRDEWNYDMESDPAYQAYKAQYQREGNRAYQDAVASMSGNTGGMMNSAAMTAGAQQLNYYNQQLNDVVPQLMNDSYNRYSNDYNMNLQALQALQSVGDSNYNKNYTASRDTINDLNNAYDTNYNRNVTEREWQDTHAQNLQNQTINDQNIKMNDYNLQDEGAKSKYYEQNAANNAESLSLANKLSQLNINATQLNNEQLKYLNMFERAQKRGSFTQDEADYLGVSVDTDPFQSEYNYMNNAGVIQNNVSLDEWNRITKPQMDYEQKLNKEMDDYQTDNQIKYDNATAYTNKEVDKELYDYKNNQEIVKELTNTGKQFYETWKGKLETGTDKAELGKIILNTESISDNEVAIIFELLGYTKDEINSLG